MGNQRRGEAHHFAKLTAEQVEKARFLLEQREKTRLIMKGLTYEAIGRRCGVGKNAIYHLAKGNSWKIKADSVD